MLNALIYPVLTVCSQPVADINLHLCADQRTKLRRQLLRRMMNGIDLALTPKDNDIVARIVGPQYRGRLMATVPPTRIH